MPQDDVDLQEDITYTERPVKILDTAERITRSRVIPMCRVQWSNHSESEAMWKKEEDFRDEFPYIFANQSESGGRDSF